MKKTDQQTGVPKTIQVWACPECGYWREERSTGIHVDFQAEPRGPGRTHKLLLTAYDLAPGQAGWHPGEDA